MNVIKIHVCSELVISHLMNDNIIYHELQSFKAEIIPLFSLFEQITFEVYSMSEYVMIH